MTPSHVLVPLDGSPLADEALSHALAVFDCRVTVLNVVTPLDAGMTEGGVLEPDEDRVAAARERAERSVETARRRTDVDGERTIDAAVDTGDPAEVIVEYVETHDVDHVVMGGHGGERTAIARRLLGTVATAVVGEAPATVTVIK
jgi:nucleotide-binding universal stress UspA family protein